MIEIAGLPAHILLIHAVVVLAPIAGLAAIVYAAAPRWRGYLAWPLGVLSLVLVPVSLLTAQAGEQLEKIRPSSALIREHAEQGDVLKAVSVGFFLVIAAAAGAFFIYQSVITGHSGAASVWAA
ncbi:hypothetical protein [Arthrobacter sp. U41]|uniref:hypothetical protein n=1 Tax=Arthrobacter sp. U41 TaxID=1849032 RepID=UPI000859254E|nr:hypothetical protein [Arthrobacter sp. U41]AOT03464.1 hypothetical protein ASPU41_09080 [Arthrobacter sp. U41]